MIEQQRAIQKQAVELARVKQTERPLWPIYFVGQNVVQPFTAGGVKFMAGVPKADTIPQRLRLTLYVAATNNATNYWTITLRTSAGTTVATATTSALAPDTWYGLDVTTFGASPLGSGPSIALDINLSRSGAGGAPGPIQLHPVLLVL